MRRREMVTMRVPISLYNKIDLLKKRFKEVNGIDISVVQASELFGSRVRLPNVPKINLNRTIFKYDEKN